MQTTTLLLLFMLGCLRAPAQPLDAIDNLFKWINDLGGEINGEVRINSDGVRGIFATKAIPEGGYLASIPAAAVMNVASYNDSFAVPTLTVLRELKSTCSRFQPYVDTWPKPDQLVNSCNMDSKYLPMFKSDFWEKSAVDWNLHLQSLLDGHLDADLEFTIQEMVGNATVTLDDLKYTCAISSTRYVSSQRRRRLLMAPIFDLANHDRLCPHYLSQYDGGNWLHFIAGRNVPAGEEICYSYGTMRDDYAVSHYGFLPALEDPPRLCLVDLPDFNPDSPYSHEDLPNELPFDGPPEALRAEMNRLLNIYHRIKGAADPLPPQPSGQDYMYDLMKKLEFRRLNALSYEINRLAGLLNVKAEL